MNRRQLREYTFKLLFHANFYDKEELNEQADNYLEECMYPEEGQLLLIEKEKEQLEKRFSMIVEKLPEIDEEITQAAEGWKLSRMNKVDLSIIRLAAYELIFDLRMFRKNSHHEGLSSLQKAMEEMSHLSL